MSKDEIWERLILEMNEEVAKSRLSLLTTIQAKFESMKKPESAGQIIGSSMTVRDIRRYNSALTDAINYLETLKQ